MFIIAGSGRSGTSAVAKLLHLSGVSVGHDLIEPDESNADGYFEERAVVEANDLILQSAGLVEWFTTAMRAEIIDASRPHEDVMRALVGQATPAWKDPRFSWTLEAWLPLFRERPRVIVCLRSPDEVAASTLRYYGADGEEPRRAVRHVWRAQYERLLDVIGDHGLEATCVEYAALHGPAGDNEVRRLSAFVGRELDASGVRRELRHHQAPVDADLAALYERVRALAARAPAT
ncbi:MAG TPA: hypothetical protein VFY79_00325 [Dehalococcoidia bacterium]|nr:hypothetical protein [Dehalococcoidia bacterium]